MKDKKPSYEELEKRIGELESEAAERKRVEATLRESEEKYRALVETTDTGYLILDGAGNVIDANAEYVRITGHRALDEIAGRCVVEWTAEHDRERNELEVKKCMEQGYVRNLEIDYVDGDGGITPIEINAKVVETKEGPRILSLCRDITERKRAEVALRESEERFRRTAENALEWIWEADNNGLYTYVSPVVEKILGYKPEEIVGKKHFYDLFHLDEREELKKGTFEVFAQKQSFREFLNRNIHRSGKEVWLSTSGIPILDEKENLLGYMGADMDVTERKQSEEAVIKAKKEAEFYLDLMAHDLTNFNQIALGNLSLLERVAELDEKQKKYLESCKRQVFKSENLISKGRAFARAKQMEKEALLSIDINKYIRDTISMVKTLYPRKLIEVEFEPSGEKIAMGNELLESVLMNVLENAVKHSSEDKVWFAVSVTDTEDDTQKFWEIRVEDKGSGIPDEMKGKIFDRYEKIGKERGIGLGLSLAKAIMEKFGGRIWVEDRVKGDHSKGSLFKIMIVKG